MQQIRACRAVAALATSEGYRVCQPALLSASILGSHVHYIADTFAGLITGLPALLAAVPFIFVGVALGWFSGLRDRLLLVASSLVVPIGLLVVVSQVLGTVGLHLSLPLMALLALSGLLAVEIMRRVIAMRRDHHRVDAPAVPSTPWHVWLAAGAGAGLGLIAWLPGIGDPTLPPQGNDDIWQGYLVARLADLPSVTAGSVAPLLSSQLSPTTFYPYGLHLLVATMHACTGISIPLLLNGLWVALALTLPFGAASLMLRMIPSRPFAASYSAVLVSAMVFFPYAENGVAPYALGLACVPTVCALALDRARGRTSNVTGVLLVLAAVGLLVTHPASAVTAAALAVLASLEIGLRTGALRSTCRRMVAPAAVTVVLCLPFLLAARQAQLPVTPPAPAGSLGMAARMAATLGTPWTSGQPVVAGLVIIGVATAVFVFRSAYALVLAYVGFVGLFVGAVTATSWGQAATGIWYAEWHRLAAVVALLASMLAGVGAAGVHAMLLSSTRRRSAQGAPWLPRLLMGVGVVGLVLLTLNVGRDILRAQSTVASAFKTPKLITAGDVLLFEHLQGRVRPEDEVLNDWQDGSTWMLAIVGVRPLAPYAFSRTQIPSLNDVFGKLDRLDRYPHSCRLLVAHRVHWAIVKSRSVSGDTELADGVAANPELFSLERRTPSGSVYRVNDEYLQKCAA